MNNLQSLWQEVNKLNKQYFINNNLRPIIGNGCCHKPKFMFVFINPTARNQSSDYKWSGPVYPFLGTKEVWRIFHRAGLFDDGLMTEINATTKWTVELARQVLKFLKQKSFYFTNVVKWTGADGTLPDAAKVKLFLPLLEEEIRIVQPENIVTFGLVPFEAITKQKIKLQDYYFEIVKTYQLKIFKAGGLKVIPCYFPVGRGNPKRAVEILKLVAVSMFA